MREEVLLLLLEQLKKLEKCANNTPSESVEIQGGIAYAMAAIAETMAKVGAIGCCSMDINKALEDKAVRPLGKIF